MSPTWPTLHVYYIVYLSTFRYPTLHCKLFKIHWNNNDIEIMDLFLRPVKLFNRVPLGSELRVTFFLRYLQYALSIWSWKESTSCSNFFDIRDSCSLKRPSTWASYSSWAAALYCTRINERKKKRERGAIEKENEREREGERPRKIKRHRERQKEKAKGAAALNVRFAQFKINRNYLRADWAQRSREISTSINE